MIDARLKLRKLNFLLVLVKIFILGQLIDVTH